MKTQQLAFSIIKSSGPMLTGELAKKISERQRCSLASATTAVSRLQHPIKKLKGIAFVGNQKFIYIEEQFASQQYQDSLRKNLIKCNAAAGRALLGIRARGGMIRKDEFSIVCGAPAIDLKKQLRDHIVLQQLNENNLVKFVKNAGNSELLYDSNSLPEANMQMVIFSLSDLLVEKCTEWCLRVGFTSTGISANRLTSKELPQFGLFNWDIAAPTYLFGLRTYNKKKKKVEAGFFAADVIVSPKVLESADLTAFKNKVEVIKSQRGMKPFIPAIIHLGMTLEAIEEMRSRGIMCLEPKSFGDPKMGEIIKELLFFFTHNAVFFKDQPRFEELIKKALSKDYGRLLNLPGPLFQMTIALLNKHQGHAIDLGKKVYSSKGDAEIDIWVITNKNELISIETKGYKKGKKIVISEINDWIDNKRPRIIEWCQNNYKDKKYKPLRFQFIISSELSAGDLASLTTKANSQHKNHPVEFLDIKDVKKLAKEFHQTEIANCLDEHYG